MKSTINIENSKDKLCKQNEIVNSISLGMVLRVIREFSGTSISELSKYLEISASAINRLENDKAKPSADTLEKYSLFFDIPSDKILFWTRQSKTAAEKKIKDVLFSMLLKAAQKNKKTHIKT